eukprot:1159341-Pelagomonas_calceolata.AAC.11
MLTGRLNLLRPASCAGWGTCVQMRSDHEVFGIKHDDLDVFSMKHNENGVFRMKHDDHGVFRMEHDVLDVFRMEHNDHGVFRMEHHNRDVFEMEHNDHGVAEWNARGLLHPSCAMAKSWSRSFSEQSRQISSWEYHVASNDASVLKGAIAWCISVPIQRLMRLKVKAFSLGSPLHRNEMIGSKWAYFLSLSTLLLPSSPGRPACSPIVTYLLRPGLWKGRERIQKDLVAVPAYKGI